MPAERSPVETSLPPNPRGVHAWVKSCWRALWERRLSHVDELMASVLLVTSSILLSRGLS